MTTLSRLKVPRRGGRKADNFIYTIMPMEPIRLLHDSHIGYGGFFLARARNTVVRPGGFLTVAYSKRRWREIARSV